MNDWTWKKKVCCWWKVVSMKRNVTAWERKQESWMNQEEWSSKTIWEGKYKIRLNQMKAIAMERQSVCLISKVGRFSQSRTLTCGFDMKYDRFWSILIDSHENGETAKQDNEICKEKASAQSKTATKSFSRRYSVKRMMAEPKIEAGAKMVLYPLIEIFIRLT